MGFTASGISATTVTTDQQAPLGFVLTVPDGDNGIQEWTYVKAGAELLQGTVAMRKGATATREVVVATTATAIVPNVAIVGVAQHTIASGSYGFILSTGIGEVLADDGGNDQLNDPLVVGGTTGRADVMAAGEEHCVFAFSTENATGVGTLMTCWINCAG
jgi:hypothetical protein|tara:strand:+ start:149 stop:628 length:480 start_codon:yes stop_codon:yes gene_type:complete